MIKRKLLYCSIIILSIAGCNAHNNNTSSESVVLKYKHIPHVRSSVNNNAVKIYTETVKSFETTDSFKVALYETKNTFDYLIKINYKQLDAEDTLRIPDFGIAPSVEIEKGDKRPSCIVGFLDEYKQFRESRLIYFEDDKIKVHVLKHYAVTTYQDTVKNADK